MSVRRVVIALQHVQGRKSGFWWQHKVKSTLSHAYTSSVGTHREDAEDLLSSSK